MVIEMTAAEITTTRDVQINKVNSVFENALGFSASVSSDGAVAFLKDLGELCNNVSSLDDTAWHQHEIRDRRKTRTKAGTKEIVVVFIIFQEATFKTDLCFDSKTNKMQLIMLCCFC